MTHTLMACVNFIVDVRLLAHHIQDENQHWCDDASYLLKVEKRAHLLQWAPSYQTCFDKPMSVENKIYHFQTKKNRFRF
jgi:uncharacterized protein YhbP (UPF0306 family)